jgi:hypothetical protein
MREERRTLIGFTERSLMVTASFLLSYRYPPKSGYIKLPPDQKKVVDKTLQKELDKVFPKELREAWIQFGVPYDYLGHADIRREVEARLAYIVPRRGYHIELGEGAHARYTPIQIGDKVEHRVTNIEPLMLVEDKVEDKSKHSVPWTIEPPEEKFRGIKADVLAVLSWGIETPDFQSGAVESERVVQIARLVLGL